MYSSQYMSIPISQFIIIPPFYFKKWWKWTYYKTEMESQM